MKKVLAMMLSFIILCTSAYSVYADSRVHTVPHAESSQNYVWVCSGVQDDETTNPSGEVCNYPTHNNGDCYVWKTYFYTNLICKVEGCGWLSAGASTHLHSSYHRNAGYSLNCAY